MKYFQLSKFCTFYLKISSRRGINCSQIAALNAHKSLSLCKWLTWIRKKVWKCLQKLFNVSSNVIFFTSTWKKSALSQVNRMHCKNNLFHREDSRTNILISMRKRCYQCSGSYSLPSSPPKGISLHWGGTGKKQ